MAGECEALGEEVVQLKQAGADAEVERDAALASIARLEAELADISADKAALEYALATLHKHCSHAHTVQRPMVALVEGSWCSSDSE